MSSQSQSYTSNGGFGKTHFSDDEGETVGSNDLDIDFSITESGRTVAHLIANMKDDSESMDYNLTESGRSIETMVSHVPPASAQQMDFSRSGGSSVNRLTRAAAAIPILTTSLQPASLLGSVGDQNQIKQPSLSGSYESSGSAFVSGLMSHTPPAESSYEARHFGKRARAGSVSGRLRSASDLEDKGIINRNQKGILKDLIICGDEQLQEALDKYEKGDKSQLETMIKSGALSQKLPADMDLLGELDLDFLTVDDATIGSMGHQNVEQTTPFTNNHSSNSSSSHSNSNNNSSSNNNNNNNNSARSNNKDLPHISFPSSSSTGGQSDDGIGELDFSADFGPGGDSDSYLRYNSRSNSIDLDSFRLRSNSMQSVSIDGRDRSNSLAYGILQNEPSADAGAAAHQRWMDRAVPGKEPLSIRRGPNAPVAVSGIGASLAEYQNRVTTKPTKAQIAEEKKRERLLKKEQKERDKLEQKERKEQERREKREQKERDKLERKGKKNQKAKLKEEEAEEEEKIVQSGTGRPRSTSDPNLRSTIDSNGLLQVERPEGWVGAYSPESRTIRIERFMEKRKHRVWTKSVKYDVRKNFADSRLRVKGRFVKKEDELLMRELMSLT